MNDTHGCHATMTELPGRGDELVEFSLKPAAGRAPAPPSNASCSSWACRSATPDTVSVTEGWTSKEAHERFLASDAAKAVAQSR